MGPIYMTYTSPSINHEKLCLNIDTKLMKLLKSGNKIGLCNYFLLRVIVDCLSQIM